MSEKSERWAWARLRELEHELRKALWRESKRKQREKVGDEPVPVKAEPLPRNYPRTRPRSDYNRLPSQKRPQDD